jgi:hypothetical protein
MTSTAPPAESVPKHKYFFNGTELSIEYPGLGCCNGVVKKRFPEGKRGLYYHVLWAKDTKGSLGNNISALYLYPCDNPKNVLAMAAVEADSESSSSWQPLKGKITHDPRDDKKS